MKAVGLLKWVALYLLLVGYTVLVAGLIIRAGTLYRIEQKRAVSVSFAVEAII